MQIWKHSNPEDYRQAQIEKNLRKFSNVWAKPKEIEAICNLLKQHVPKPSFGLCHGVRNGWEVQEFKRRLGCLLVGTDISHTAATVPDCVVWDFHDRKPEWEGTADFIYTNSFDHANDPAKALGVWKDQLKPGGLVFVGWFEKSGIDSADCFLASFEEVEEMMESVFGNAQALDVGRKSYLVYWAKKP